MKRAAAVALGTIDASAKNLVPELTAALSDRDADIRQLAAMAIGYRGANAKVAVSRLVESLADPSTVVREKSAHALGSVLAGSGNVIPGLFTARGGSQCSRSCCRGRCDW